MPIRTNLNFIISVVLLAMLAEPALAQSIQSPVFERNADEKALTDLQLLGKRLFEDATLSEPRGMSYMSCHAPQHAFQGNNGSPIAAIALGSRPDQLGTRKVPSLLYSPLRSQTRPAAAPERSGDRRNGGVSQDADGQGMQ